MTEAKRVTLTTISSTVSSSLMTAGSSGSIRFGADLLAQTEKSTTASTTTKTSAKTIRINVELFQTDSNKYPEFNYAKLLHLEKKKLKKLKQKSNGFSDPFEDNDDDVARIAKELEKKYGNAYSTGRGKNKRGDVDIGLGYDESDSFIDNTEAYDELIPDEVETIEGGFYINCGALEFKKLHTESYTTKTDEIIKMPNRPKKRVISSSSEESSSSGDDDDDDDEDDESDDEVDDESNERSSVETSKSKSSASTNDKKSKSSSTTTLHATKKKAIAVENGGVPKKNKEKMITSLPSFSASSSPKISAEERTSDIERNAKKVEKTTTVKDMLKAQRDNFLKSQTTSVNGESKSKSSAAEDDDDSSTDDSDDDDDVEGESGDNSDTNQSGTQISKDKKQASEDQGNEKFRTSDTNLPDLDMDILSSIIELRDGIKSQNLIGKKFQFDEKLSENFLKIDDSLLCLDKAQRNMVFAHLEFQLSLPKYYFLRKAKQLRIKEEKLKSKRTFNKLLKAITETMPAVSASYEAELRRFTELQTNPNTDQPPKMPKKKFPWNTNIRNLLYDVYQVRWTSYPVLGTRKETLEDFITCFMREKVVDIWPKGWMRYEELQKEIEKRKMAVKKAKEKKKLTPGAVSRQSSPNPNVAHHPLTSLQIANVSSIGGTAINNNLPNIAGTTTTQPVSFNKHFEEFTNRSNANSDTDSVASSSTSSGLKRKNICSARNKPTKPKAPKLNGDQTKSMNSNSKIIKTTPTEITVDLVSSNKRTDHSINHIMSPTEANIFPSISSSIFSATTAAVSQPLKHSTSTHVIDLDNYKSVGDILQTSKEITAAANAAATALTTINSTFLRRESSGDSEIEIVGVFPAKQPNKKIKVNNRSATPNSNHPNSEKAFQSSSNHNSYNNSNNNTINRKKGVQSGLTGIPGMDVNKMVNTLMELGDELQLKPILKSTAQQQTKSSSSTQMSLGPGSLQ